MRWRPKPGSFPRFLKFSVWGILLTAGLGATFLLSAYHTMRLTVSGRQIPVPNLIQMKVTEAEEILKSMRLRLDVVTERFDPRAGKDRILEQDPVPDSPIKPGRKVKVVLSLGTRILLVPELRGSSARKAQITLRQEGLRVGEQAFLHSSSVEQNQVIAQDPPPTTPRQRDGRVNLLISRGAREVRYVMPDLVGRQLPEVKSFLNIVGMKIGQVREENSSGGEPGAVLRQYPPPGFPVSLRQPVTLVTSATEEDPEEVFPDDI